MENLFFLLSFTDSIDQISFAFSIFGFVVALISLYYSRFKLGNLKALPLKLYAAQPLNFSSGRAVRVVSPVTIVNTGASIRAINDLRMRIIVPGQKDLILDWVYEYKELSLTQDIGVGILPAQPTIKSYESMNKIFGFQSNEDATDAIVEIEKHEKAEKYKGFIEYYNDTLKWKILSTFYFEYNGYRKWEMNYKNINVQ